MLRVCLAAVPPDSLVRDSVKAGPEPQMVWNIQKNYGLQIHGATALGYFDSVSGVVVSRLVLPLTEIAKPHILWKP